MSTFTRIETVTGPRSLSRFQQRNSARIFGGVAPGVTKDQGLRVLEDAARATGGSAVTLDYAGESRQIRQEGQALTTTLGFALILIYLVLAAQFHSFRDPLIVLLGSVPLAISGALVFTFTELTTINIYSQVGLITLVGPDCEERHPDRGVREHLAGTRARKARRDSPGDAHSPAAGVDDVGRDSVRPLPVRARLRSGRGGA